VAIEVIQRALSTLDDISQQQAPQGGIEEFGDFAIKIGVRYWVPTNRYFKSMYTGNREIYKAIREAGINIPFPKLDLNLADGKLGID